MTVVIISKSITGNIMSINCCESCNKIILMDDIYEPVYPDVMLCEYCCNENFKGMTDFSPIVAKLNIIQQKWNTYSHEFIHCIPDEINKNPYDSEKDDVAICWKLVCDAIETQQEKRMWNKLLRTKYNVCIRTPGEISKYELDKTIKYFCHHINVELRQQYFNEISTLDGLENMNLSTCMEY